jgi:hypothetical protein
MSVFIVTYYQGTKKVGQTGPYATRRAAAADAKTMIRNHVGANYPITELYTSTKTTGKPKMVAPQVMKKEKYAEWQLYREQGRKKYQRRLPTNKVPEVAGYSAQGPKEGVLRASISKTSTAKWVNSMKLKYNPAGKKHAVLLRRNGQMYGYFGPYTSKSLAEADAAALRSLTPASVTVEASPVSQTRASTKKTTRRNAATAPVRTDPDMSRYAGKTQVKYAYWTEPGTKTVHLIEVTASTAKLRGAGYSTRDDLGSRAVVIGHASTLAEARRITAAYYKARKKATPVRTDPYLSTDAGKTQVKSAYWKAPGKKTIHLIQVTASTAKLRGPGYSTRDDLGPRAVTIGYANTLEEARQITANYYKARNKAEKAAIKKAKAAKKTTRRNAARGSLLRGQQNLF